MRSRGALVALILGLLASSGTAQALDIPGTFCDGSGSLIQGVGSTLQDPLTAREFIPAFENRCPSGSGLVRHLRLGEEFAFERFKDHDPLYPLITVDRPLSTVEATLATNDLPARRGRFSFIVHLPVLITPTVVAYNNPCPGLPKLQLSSSTLSLMFAGMVLRWNDPAVLRDNPSVAALESCGTPVKLATRVDRSPTTRALKEYLGKRNPFWAVYNQPETATLWPPLTVENCQGLGDEGVAACVARSPGYVGYFAYATLSIYPGLRTARIDDPEGDFTGPSLAGCTAAAQYAYDTGIIPGDASLDWGAVSLIDLQEGYPLCSFSYVLAYTYLLTGYFGQLPASGMRTLRDYLGTLFLPSTQSRLPARGFTPLPADIRAISQDGVAQLEFF